MIIFGGMNNYNYIGSSLFIINLDFYRHPEKVTEEEHAIELLKNSAKILGPEALKLAEKKKKRVIRRQLSTIDELILPPIK